MQIISALYLATLLALSGLVGANARAVEGSRTFCHWTRSAAQGRSHYCFLRLTSAEPTSLQMYHSVWTQDRRLVDCSMTDEPAVTEKFLSLCRQEQAEDFTDIPETNFNVSILFAPDNACADPFSAGVQASGRAKRQIEDPITAEHRSGDGTKVALRRQKRAWIIPGTVWCGTGDKAEHYDDLGIFGRTDKCCREHDHCTNIIPSFTYGYGVFNRHFFTLLHCDCEDRFRQCLLKANDRVSYMVGYAYFNLLKSPCFTLTEKMQCTQTNWFGMCTLSEMSPYAVLHEPKGYNATQPVPEEEQFGTHAVPSATPISQNVTSKLKSLSPTPFSTPSWNSTSPMAGTTRQPPVRRPKPQLRCPSKSLANGTDPWPGRRKGPRRKGCVERSISPPLPPTGRDSGAPLITGSAMGDSNAINPPRHRGGPSLENALPTAQPRTPRPVPHNQPAPVEDTQNTEKFRPCDCYKQLDECRLKIPPLEERFGLKNLERKTMYHCNCTDRLAQQLWDQAEPDGVQSLLVDFISLSCFLLPPPEECLGKAKGCSAVLSDAPHLQLALTRQRNSRGGENPETPILKVKRHNTRKSARKQIPVRLYRRCLRILTSKRRKHLKAESSVHRFKYSPGGSRGV